MKQMKNITIKTITLSILSSSLLLSATPNIGDVEKQIKTPDIKKEQAVLPEIKQKEYKTPMVDSGKKILISDFKIIGNEHISNSELKKIFVEFKNKELTFNQLQEISSSITKYYREKGYFVSRAYIPAQNILENKNVLEIAIIEGNYGEFKLDNKSLVKDSVLQGMIDDAKARDNIISTDTLERAMLIINDTPGVIVTGADVMPGSNVGTSDFAITTAKTKRVDGYVVVDNYGSRYTGKNRAMLGANIYSPFNIGDKISAFGLISNGEDLLNGKIAYEAPLASNGLTGELSYSQTNYSLTKEYDNLDATGTAKTIEGKISYPVIRTRTENLNVYTSLLSKDLKDEIKSTNDLTQKDSKSMKVGIDYDKDYVAFNKNTKSIINTYLTYGRLSFDDDAKKATDEAGANTNGNYSKINVDLEHNIAFTPKLSLDSILSLQYALGNKNLDGSEDLSVGGSNGVKLYPDGELSAENGYIFTTELKYQLPQISSLNSTVGVFYDRGKAFMANNNVDFESKSLQDTGIGLYNSYDNFFSKIQVAWNVNSKEVTSEPNRNSRILFQGGMTF
ncbi:MAG: ShlB/FhaC/HecB family hemolysin secretion/activation protein [Aliarcobacter sp.]|nr:ShlB/FhaC/HecB family hemolysin secretion/activation protein [Aliarcobacter sp.]